MNFTVSEVRLSSRTLLLSLEPRDGQILNFVPGQYVAISFYRSGRPTPMRCFSIASNPNSRGKVVLGMRVDGRFTRAASQLKSGDRVRLSGPFGEFTLDAAESAEHSVFFAGGIGITPFMSILRSHLPSRPNTKITLIYSHRNPRDIAFLSDLAKLEHTYPNFRVVYALSGNDATLPNGLTLHRGRVDADLVDRVVGKSYASVSFYICGPQIYMSSIQRILRKRGVLASQIFSESFAQRSKHQASRAWTLNVYAMSAVALVVGTFIIMTFDLLKTLPSKSSSASTTSSNSQNVDQAINQVSPTVNNSTSSNTSQSTSTSNVTQSPAQTTIQSPRTAVS